VVRRGRAPTLEFAAEQLHVAVDDLDRDFGVVAIDPRRGLYCVEVRADRLPPELAERRAFRGPYSNPKIAPFAPAKEAGASGEDEEPD
jgi:hypothetical protein